MENFIFCAMKLSYVLVYPQKHLRAEIDYLTDMFCKNGYDQKTVQKIISNFEKKTLSINNNNNSTNKKQTCGCQMGYHKFVQYLTE